MIRRANVFVSRPPDFKSTPPVIRSIFIHLFDSLWGEEEGVYVNPDFGFWKLIKDNKAVYYIYCTKVVPSEINLCLKVLLFLVKFKWLEGDWQYGWNLGWVVMINFASPFSSHIDFKIDITRKKAEMQKVVDSLRVEWWFFFFH